MIFALLAPEVLLGAAVTDLLSAKTSEDDMRDFAIQDGVDWTSTHGFLANIGGFVVRFDDEEIRNSRDPEEGITTRKQDRHEQRTPTETETPFGRERDDANKVVNRGKGKSNPLTYPALKTDEEILLEASRLKELAKPRPISKDAREKTFSSFDLIWASRRLKHKFDSWVSLSALGRQNVSQPWNMGPAMDWRPHPENQTVILQSLSLLKCNTLESVFPLYLNLAALQGNIWVLDARQLYFARKWGIITLPDISEEEAYDKSKSDVLIKLIALGQMIWLAVELITRHIRGHPTTQLEIMTLAFSACSSVTYLLLLKKPKDVKFPITIHARRLPTPIELLTLANFGPLVWFDAIMFERWTSGRTNFWIPNTACHFVHRQSFMGIRLRRYGAFWLGSAAGALLLGSFHALAWNVVFPTRTEMLLWRIASVLTVAIPWIYLILGNIVLGLFFICAVRSGKVKAGGSSQPLDLGNDVPGILMRFSQGVRVLVNTYYAVLSFIALLVYSLVRLFLLVEVFRSLAYLPPTAYVATFA
jgi:hypothetical protein